MGSVTETYNRLGIADALIRPYDYSPACKELAFVLRGAYSRLPKNLQSLVYDDAIAAFRLLPKIGTVSSLSSANLLIQAAEAALPKQRKALAVSEFKHAVVLHKRRLKAQQEFEGSMQLPHDVLVHIFTFLDVQSLAAVSLVCRTWKSAASDATLWKIQYCLYFGSSNAYFENKKHRHQSSCDGVGEIIYHNQECAAPVNSSYRKNFRTRWAESLWSFSNNRIYCWDCKAIIWLSSMTCYSVHRCFDCENGSSNIKPFPHSKVMEYLFSEAILSSSSDSDSDSDTEESPIPSQRLAKLWALPKHLGSIKQQSSG